MVTPLATTETLVWEAAFLVREASFGVKSTTGKTWRAWKRKPTRWRHQMETFSALLAFCAGNSPMNSPHKGQWRGALIFFYLRLNKRLSKQSWRRSFETPSCALWRQYNEINAAWWRCDIEAISILLLILFFRGIHWWPVDFHSQRDSNTELRCL